MKHCLWIVFACCTLWACQTSEEPLQTDTPISFAANEAQWNGLRSADYTGDAGVNPLPDMLVYGYYTQNRTWENTTPTDFPFFMNGIEVHRQADMLTYSPLRYYFATGYHSFVAFAPNSYLFDAGYNGHSFNQVTFPNDQTLPALQYQLPTDEANQQDIVCGWALDKTAASQGSNPVNLVFQHATTKIAFSACLEAGFSPPPNLHLSIKSIELSNVYAQAQLNLPYNQINGVPELVWDMYQNFRTVYQTVANGNLTNTTLSHTMQALTTENGAWYLIPQILSGRAEADKPILKLLIQAYDQATEQSDNYTVSIDLSLSSTYWLPGQFINYQIEYTGEGVNITLHLVDPGTGNPDDLGNPLG